VLLLFNSGIFSEDFARIGIELTETELVREHAEDLPLRHLVLFLANRVFENIADLHLDEIAFH
jgi:hypothetical protein